MSKNKLPFYRPFEQRLEEADNSKLWSAVGAIAMVVIIIFILNKIK